MLGLRSIRASRSAVLEVSSLRRTAARALCIFFCLLAIAATAPAQTNTAAVTGTVTDQSGAAVPNATVTATNTKTAIAESEATDESGHYTVPNLVPGFYDVAVTAQGFAKTVRTNQELLVGSRVTMDFPLQVSTVSQTVEVTTAAPIVDATQAVLSRVVQTDELDSLPIINRSFASLAQLSPGVQVNTAGTTIQFGDSGTYSNGYIVDGNSIEKFNNGGQIVNFAQDWIQEFSVVTQQAPAEYGLSSAGYINAVTRSGGNDMHGRAYGYFQNAALNATPWFPVGKTPVKAPFHQDRLGGFLGGPIKADKLFYFIGFEYLNNLTSNSVNIPVAFNTPDASNGIYPSTNVEYMAIAKVDYQINKSQAVHIRANEDYPIVANSGVGATRSLGMGTSSRTMGHVFQATWDDVLSPAMLNELRADYYANYTHIGCNMASILGPYTGGGPNATPYGDPTGFYATVTYTGVTVGCTSLWGGQGERNWLFADDLTITKGKHEIKVGVDAGRRNQYNRSVHRLADGTYTEPGSVIAPFSSAGPQSQYPISYSVNWEPGNSLSNNEYSPYFGLFAQDSWTVNGDLTLNIGIRYDMDFGNSYIDTLPSLNPIHNDATDVAPRAGFAWTPLHNSKRTVIRGGFGIYYDLQHGNVGGTYYTSDVGPTLALNLSATNKTLNPYCTGTTCSAGIPAADVTAVEAVLAYALAHDQLPNFAPPGGTITLGTNTYTIPTLAGLPPTGVFNYVEDLKHPASLQTSMGVAQQIGDSLGISADFVYNHGYNQYGLYNANINPSTFAPINPNYTSISTYNNGVSSKLYSLRMQGHYRDHRGDGLQVAYALTYGWDNSANSALALVTTQTQATDPFNFNIDYGPGALERHNLNVSGTIKAPWGIQISPILTFFTGLPYTATTTLTAASLPASIVPVGCMSFYSHCYPTGYSKNSIRGGNSFTANARISKTFKFKERYSAMVMFEGYNLTNRANFTAYNAGDTISATTGLPPATFMQPTTAGPTRQLQAGFEFDF